MFIPISRQRRAFTLVELLVVIAIIGILIALLLPAVQAAREAARRSECTNKIKQLGLGVHNYHDTYRKFPYAYRDETLGNQRNRGTLFFWILPYLELGNLYDNATLDSFDPSKITGGAGNGSGKDQSVDLYVCPSDSTGDGGLFNAGWGMGSYEFNFQVFANKHPIKNASQARMASITDGTSNTLIFAESLQKCGGNGTLWNHGDWNVPYMPMFGGGANETDTTVALTTGTASVPQSVRERVGCDARRSTASGHPGGVNVGLGDGSVKFIPTTIDGTTWWRLVQRDDGQTVGSY